MYVCMYVSMYVYMYLCAYVFYVCTYVCMCVYVRMYCMYVCVCLCMSIYSQSIHLSVYLKCAVQPESPCVTNLPSLLEVEPQFIGCLARNPVTAPTELSRLLVRLLTLGCHSEYEFQTKCQARIRSVCHPRAVRCQEPHINRGVIEYMECWLWVVSKSVRRITMRPTSLVSIVTAATVRPSSVFSQTVQFVLNFVLRSHYTQPENKICFILEHEILKPFSSCDLIPCRSA